MSEEANSKLAGYWKPKYLLSAEVNSSDGSVSSRPGVAALGSLKELSDAVKYWLGAIEHHAAEITNPRKHSGGDAPFLASGNFLGLALLKDIYYLRTQLISMRGAEH